MKKTVVLIVILIFAATTLSAQMNMSAGFGGYFDGSFRNGVRQVDNSGEVHRQMRNLTFGGFAFFDVTYAELDIGFGYGEVNAFKITYGPSNKPPNKQPEYYFDDFMQLNISLLGKYPIEVAPTVSIYPLIGFNYNIVMNSVNKHTGVKREKAGSFSQVGFQGGLGGDINMTDAFFLRIQGLAQIRFTTGGTYDYCASYMDEDGNVIKKNLGVGPVIKAGIGMRL